MYLCQCMYFCVFQLYFLVIVFRRNSVASSPTNAWAGLQSMGGRRLGSSTKDKMWDGKTYVDSSFNVDWDQENLDQFSLCQNQEAISSTKCKQGRFQKGIYWVFIEKEGYLDHRSKPMSSSRQRRDVSCKDPIWGPGSRINYLENQFGEI